MIDGPACYIRAPHIHSRIHSNIVVTQRITRRAFVTRSPLGFAMATLISPSPAACAQTITTPTETIGPGAVGPTSVVCLGDSITVGGNATTGGAYPTRLGLLLGPAFVVTNAGANSAMLSHLQGRIATHVLPHLSADNRNVVVILGGINDISQARTGEQVYDAAASLCIALRAACPPGTIIGICTLLSAQYGYNPQRNAANALIRNGYATFANFLIDLAADPRIGDDDDSADRTLYADGVHPTDRCYGYIADDVAAAILNL